MGSMAPGCTSTRDRATESSADSAFLTAVAVLILLYLLLRMLRRQSSGRGGSDHLASESPRALRRRAKQMLSQGRPSVAGDLFLQAGDKDAALAAFLRGGQMGRAAPLFEERGELPAAGEAYETAGDSARAARVWARLCDHERAARAYEAAGQHADAVKHWNAVGAGAQAGNALWQAGDFEKAAASYQKAGLYEEAGRAYQVLLDAEKQEADAAPLMAAGPAPPSERLVELARLTGRTYMTAGKLAEAAAAFLAGGLDEEAGRAYEQSGRYGDAAELALGSGDPARAAELYDRAGDGDRALSMRAKAAHEGGDARQAAALLEQAGDLASAARIWEEVGELARAAKVLELLKDWVTAAGLWERVGHPARAASDWLRAGEKWRAAELYRTAGDHDQELRLRTEIGDNARVGEILLLAGETEKAEEVLKSVTEAHSGWKAACSSLGDLYRDAGNHAAAAVKYRQALMDLRPDAENAALFYRMGHSALSAGEMTLAIDTLRDLREFDPMYEDVQALYDQARRQKGKAVSVPDGKVPGALASATPGEETLGLSHTRKDAGGPPRYERLDVLGQGGMATVWRAKDLVLGREVALKVLQGVDPDQEVARKRFLREARSAAGLNHPAVVTVYDFGEDAGDLFIAMELVEGMTLRQIVREGGALGIELVSKVLLQACDAIGYAHGQNVIHRDIKPANLMWTGGQSLRITDFGLAKLLNDEGLTNMSRVLGTPYYMSPEQIRGDQVDLRTDIYSLGVTLYELCTAKVPFSRGNVLQAHLNQSPEPPSTFRPDLPSWLEGAVLACIRKDPDDRPQSMGAVAALVPSS